MTPVPRNRVRRDQCDEVLSYVAKNPGCTLLEIGAAVYPWDDLHGGYRLRRPVETRQAFAARRLRTLLDRGEVVRQRGEGLARWWVARGAS